MEGGIPYLYSTRSGFIRKRIISFTIDSPTVAKKSLRYVRRQGGAKDLPIDVPPRGHSPMRLDLFRP